MLRIILPTTLVPRIRLRRVRHTSNNDRTMLRAVAGRPGTLTPRQRCLRNRRLPRALPVYQIRVRSYATPPDAISWGRWWDRDFFVFFHTLCSLQAELFVSS